MQSFRTRVRTGHSAGPVFRWSVVALCAGLCLAPPATVRADELGDVQQLLKSGQSAEALKRADQFLASRPKDAQMRFLKGVALTEQNRAGEAQTVFMKITEDFPELPEPYNNLAVLYAQQGQFDKARTALEMAIRTNPSYATAYENLGDVYAKLASQAYAKALQVDAGNTAVAPKLALIRDLFVPASAAGKAVAVAAAAPKAVALMPAPAPPPAARPAASAAPAAVAAPASAAPPGSVPASATASPSASAPRTVTAAVARPAPAVQAAAASASAALARPEVPPKAPVVARAATPSPPPAPTPPSPPPPAPTPAAASGPQAEVQAAVQAWAQAWSRKDLEAYFAAYLPDYPAAATRSSWRDDRRARILGKSRIKVAISELAVQVDGERATARFRQAYAADSLSVSSRKTLSMVRRGDKWLIEKESVGS